MVKNRTTKATTPLLVIGMLIIAGCQSVPQDRSRLAQEASDATICIAELPPRNEHGQPISVTLEDTLSMELRVFFDQDSVELKEKYTSQLDKLTEFAARCSNLTLFVHGHTSKLEQQAADKQIVASKGLYQQSSLVSLAGARAQSIKNYLVTMNLPASRIRIFDCGADYPIASDDTKEGSSMNQRVFGWMSARARYGEYYLGCREVLE